MTKTALVTGGSAGLGLALVTELTDRGWHVITDGRDAQRLQALRALPHADRLTIVPGDVTDAAHRQALARSVDDRSRLDLLVHNASTLGPLPMRALSRLDDTALDDVWRTNTAAPLALTRALLPSLQSADGVVLSISSDAAVEHYETWGAYAATKAALDHLTLTLGAEEGLTTYAVDPGDMRTQMHQDAFPGEDISDRPLPATVAPRLLALLANRPAPGRYRASDFPQSVASEAAVV